MRSQQHVSHSAKCPFYHKHDAQRIFCDGVAENSASSSQYFEAAENKRKYMREYCTNDCWKQCAHAAGLLKKP